MELAEFMIKIIVIATLTIGILGMVLQSASFEGAVQTYDKERLAVDVAQAISAAPCLTVSENGDARKGLLDSSKLNAQTQGSFCISSGTVWSAEVSSVNNLWTFGNPELNTQTAAKKIIPVAIMFPEGVRPGKITVRIG